MKEIFSDGLSDIYVSRGLAYLDFYHLVPNEQGRHEPVVFLRITIPLSLKGFFGLIQTGDAVVNHLIDIGILSEKQIESESAKKDAAPVSGKKAEKKSAPAKKAEAKPASKPAPAPAKKAEAKPAAKPAPAPAKKAEAKPAAKPAPAKKAAPAASAPAKKPAAKGKKPAK